MFAAKKLDEFPGFSVRIIPSATSLFNVAKLSMSRNNVRSVSAGTPFVSTFKNVEASFLLIILIFFFVMLKMVSLSPHRLITRAYWRTCFWRTILSFSRKLSLAGRSWVML